MATNVWQGNAPAVKEVSTFTVSLTWATNDTATLTCGSASVTFTVGGTQTIAAVVAGLVAAWNDTTNEAPETAEVTASDNSPDITLTSDTAGIPFTVTSSEVTATDGVVGDQVDTTANSGPNCWDTAANWSLGAVPVATNDVVFENSSISCLYGLAQSGATLTSFKQFQTFTGTIGLPRNNTADVSNPYAEYRPTYLAVDVTSVYLGIGGGAGSGRIKLDTGTVQTDVNIWDSGVVIESGIPAILWKGTHASNTLTIDKGSLGVAFYGGELATILTLKVAYTDNQATDVSLICGVGLTLTTQDIDGGVVTINNDGVTTNQRAGVLTVLGSAAMTTTLRLDGGTCHWNSVGQLTLPIVSGGGVLDFRRDNRTRTVVNCEVHENGSIYDPAGTVTWTGGIKILQSTFANRRASGGVVLEMPESKIWTPTST